MTHFKTSMIPFLTLSALVFCTVASAQESQFREVDFLHQIRATPEANAAQIRQKPQENIGFYSGTQQNSETGFRPNELPKRFQSQAAAMQSGSVDRKISTPTRSRVQSQIRQPQNPFDETHRKRPARIPTMQEAIQNRPRNRTQFASTADSRTNDSTTSRQSKSTVEWANSIQEKNFIPLVGNSNKKSSPIKMPQKGESKSGKKTTAVDQQKLLYVGGCVGIVLLLFFGVRWLSNRSEIGSGTPFASRTNIPDNVLQVLGKAPLSPQQELHLVKLADRILLLAVSQNTTETLGEVSEPDEVEAVVRLCKSGSQNRIPFEEALARIRLERQPRRPISPATA